MKKISLVSLHLILFYVLHAQNSVENSTYNPQEIFTQSFKARAGNAFRSGKEIPDPIYWQNNSSYLIHATLNEKDTSVIRDATITYTNNSPDQLDYLWLQLDQNIFKSSSKSVAATKYPGNYFEVLYKINGAIK